MRQRGALFLGSVSLGAALLIVSVGAAGDSEGFSSRALWERWPDVRVSPANPYDLKHNDLLPALARLSASHPGLFEIREEGRSAEGRRIPLLVLGRGGTRVLLWSQMHGDEPTATSALLDVISFLGRTRGEPATDRLLERLTLYVIPMLNPDGAERGRRWNAQGIDVNRDALRLSTPEGRFLKSVRDRYAPAIGYNLHNHSALTTAGPNGEQVAISLLSVPFDEAFTENEGRRKTRRLAVKVRDLLEPFARGRVARYDTDYTARAFGDSLTRWGTPTLLIESGGWNGPDEQPFLVRLNFVALLGSFEALCDGSLDAIDPKAYDAIPLLSRDRLFDVIVRNATVVNGAGLPPFLADVGLVRPSRFGGSSPRAERVGVVEMGDLASFRGKEEIDAAGLVLAPAPPAGGEIVGTEDELARAAKGWTKDGAALWPGYAGELVLLEKTGSGSWRVKRRLGPQ